MKECKFAKYCGGCSNLNIEYNEQLLTKSKHVEDCLKNEGIDYSVPATVGAFFPYKYRNKVHLAIKEFKGKTIIGFYEEGSSKVVDIDSCLLHDNWLKDLIVILREYVKKYRITPYDNVTKSGIIRYVVARVIDNKIMITLVATTRNFAGREYLYAKLSEKFKQVSLYINVNKRTDKLVFDDKNFFFVKGEKYIESSMLGVKYCIAPNSFLQVNIDICKAMYNKSLELLEINEKDNILDLYSGIGITSILFANKCNNVVSIEYNKDATKMAELNKKLNKINNLNILTGPCGELINTINKENITKVFLDPARMGAEEETLNWVNGSRAKTVVYMSCEPTTLARDLKILKKEFEIITVETYDMFPYTNHVETLVCLQRREENK